MFKVKIKHENGSEETVEILDVSYSAEVVPSPEPLPEPSPIPEPVPLPTPTTEGIYEPPDTSNEIEGRNLWPAPALSKPTPDQNIIDPVFGTTMRAMPDGWRHAYSQLQAFSFDDKYVLLFAENKNMSVWDISQQIPKFVFEAVGNGVRWLPGTHKVISTLENSPGISNNVQILIQDISETTPTTLMNFPNLKFMDDNKTYEEISRGPRKFMPLWITSRTDKTGGPWIIIVELSTKTIVSDFEFLFPNVDWINITPDEKFLLVQTTSNLGLYDLNGKFIKNITDHRNHGDIGLDTSGNWFFVSSEILHPRNNNYPGIYRYTETTKDVLRMVDWGKTGHFSALAYKGAPIAIYGSNVYGDILKGEVYLLNHDGSLLRLAHHRSTEGDYWRQPHASISESGKFVIFASDWNDTNNKPTSYIISVPVHESIPPIPEPTPIPEPIIVSLNLNEPKQTMKGWTAVAQAGQWECPEFSSYASLVYDMAANDLGINRLRIEAYSGIQANTDWFAQWRNGTIDNTIWKSKRYEPEQGAPIHMTMINDQIDKVVLPMISRWNAKGRKWATTLCFVDFTPASQYNHRKDPSGYANFVVTIFNNLKSKYNIVPDALEIILEHDIAGWSNDDINNCIVAARQSLNAAGFTPDVVGPSSANATLALQTYNALTNKPDVLSYHRYGGVTTETIASIGTKPRTAMIEWGGADINTIWEDLTVANVEEWMQFSMSFCGTTDGGYKYIFGTNPPRLETRAYKLKHIFREVDIGAVRYNINNIPSNARIIGFKNPNGKIIFVVESQNSISLSFGDGNWEAFYTPQNGTTTNISVPSNGNINLAAGLLTISKIAEVVPTPIPEPTPTPSNVSIGTNVEPIIYSGFDAMFLNVFKMAGASGQNNPAPWVSRNRATYAWDEARKLDMDINGNVKSLLADQFASTLIPCSLGGEYTLTYSGEGQINLSSATIKSQTNGKIVFTTNPYVQVQLDLMATNPSKYLKNIKVVETKYINLTQTFHPDFLSRISPFSTLRFMDTGNTNNSNIVSWSQRTSQYKITQISQFGMAYEHMIEMCNALSCNLWVCIPHKTDDAFVSALATLIRDNLNSSLKVYIEWSNEVWNGTYQQAFYALQQGVALNLAPGDDYLSSLLYQTKRSVEVFKIFENVFGGTSRLIRTLGLQHGNAWAGRKMLAFNNAYQSIDALAVAPYFGRLFKDNEVSLIQNGGIDWVINEATTSLNGEVLQWMKDSKICADEFGVKLIAYEGGQHNLTPITAHQNQQIIEIINASQRDPRMYDLYIKLLTEWKNLGCDMFCHYTFCQPFNKFNTFGSLETINQDLVSAPKYRALLAFINS